MNQPTDRMAQSEVDELLRQFASSGTSVAVAGDDRYTMKLQMRGPVTWLAIRGVIMQPIPTEFSDRLQQLLRDKPPGAVLVDMRQCTYLCSSALGVLALLLTSDRVAGGRVVLLGASEKMRKLMVMVGLEERFVTVDSEDAAARTILARPTPS